MRKRPSRWIRPIVQQGSCAKRALLGLIGIDGTESESVRRTARNRCLSLGVERLESRQLLAGDFVIAEFMASNDNGLRDEDHTRPDWIEILNTSDTDASLDGWFLTDDANDLDKWRIPDVRVDAGKRVVIFASGKNRALPDHELHTNFRLNIAGDYLALVQPDGVTVEDDFGGPYPRQLPDVSYGIAQSVAERSLHLPGDAARLWVPHDDSLGRSWTEIEFDDSSWSSQPTGMGYGSRFRDVIQTDLEPAMRDINSSIYLRLPFRIDDPSAVFRLTWTVQFNDGYVALLNGVEVARRNAPDELVWNSLATDRRDVAPSLVAEEVDLSPFVDLLEPGENVLAIHGLNSHPNSSRFLMVPQLTAYTSEAPQLDRLRYFTSPSPGGANGVGTTTALLDVSHSPSVPGVDDDLTVTTIVQSDSGGAETVTLHYRVMFGAETSVPMLDDGLHGDGERADGRFGATIPAGVASAGQMLRYRITAGDSAENLARSPAFVDPLTTEQYHGTVVADPSIQSNLPVLHLFVAEEDLEATETSQGAHGSLFHDGRFYDNIEIDVTGRTIGRSGPKKSHDVFLPRDDWFQPAGTQLRMDDFDLITDFWNRAKVRIPLAYETFRNIGSPAHLSFPVRVQRNGEFFGTYSFVDGGNERFLERAGLDRRGALYKMNLGFRAHEAAFKKQTRKFEDYSDLEALFDGLDLTGTARAQFLLDHVNIPAVVNYLVGLVLMGHGDCCSKNLYLYRDTEGTGLWEPLPWDVDSSFGRGGAASEPIVPQAAGVDTLGRGNTLFAALFTDVPGFRSMYLRRLRSVMDQFLQPPGTPAEELKFERRIDEMVQQMAPDAQLDFQKWGSWQTDPVTDVTTYGIENIPTWQDHVDILKNEYFPARRIFLYDSLTRANGGQVLPPQTEAPDIHFGQIEFNPASDNQDEEFIELTNPNDVAVDITGWQLTGDLQYAFDAGTVIPSGATLYVSPNVNAFRARATGPSGGQGLLVQGNYTGHLSNHGATIRLAAADGTVVDEVTTPAAPSPAQQFLRISEIMYHPRDPLPGSRFEDDDYEFIELINTSDDVALSLGNVALTQGVQFAFPPMSLAPGQRVVVARNEAAFAERYGQNLLVAGQYGGTADGFRLSNQGESIRLDIGAGDVIQEFVYDDAWFPSTDGGGRSLTITDVAADVDRWNRSDHWQASASQDGSPGSADGIESPLGDANRDGRFDQLDLVFVLEGGKYLTGDPASFADGDWNGDGVFDQRDIVAVLQAGNDPGP